MLGAFLLGFSLACLLFSLWPLHSRPQATNARLVDHNIVDDGHRNSIQFSQSTPTLMILIFSSPRNVKRREVIRDTWIKFIRESSPDKQGARVRHLFVVGMFGLEKEVAASLLEEQATNNDMLMLSQLKDGYSWLTYKLKKSFSHLSAEYSFDYLLKVDDDSFVQLNLLYDVLVEQHAQLEHNGRRPLYMGYFSGHATVKNTGKWSERHWFLCDHYLPYALGGGYLLSRTLVDYVANNAELLENYRSEDVSLGVWLAALKVHRLHDVRFDTEWTSRGCIDSFLIQHKQTPEEMKTKYESISEGQGLCREGEWEQRLSYIYNWKVPPSKCCVRNISLAN